MDDPEYLLSGGSEFYNKSDRSGDFSELALLTDSHSVRSDFQSFTASKSFKPKTPWFIGITTACQVLLFLACLIVNHGISPLRENPWLGLNVLTLKMMGAKYGPEIVNSWGWWRLIVAVFLHAGFFHIAMNLLAQIFIGFHLERAYGWWRIMFVYLCSGFGGNLLSTMFLPCQVSVGASSAIYGLMSVYLADILMNWRYYTFPRRQVIIWTVSTLLSLLFGLLPYVDNFAHIGGCLFGLLSSLVISPKTLSLTKEYRISISLRVIGAVTMAILTILGVIVIYSRLDLLAQCHWCRNLNCINVFSWCKAHGDGGHCDY